MDTQLPTRPLPLQMDDRRPRHTTITPHPRPSMPAAVPEPAWTRVRLYSTILAPLAMGVLALTRFL